MSSELKGKFKIEKIIHPRFASSVESGTWTIMACSLVEELEGKFVANKYGNYSFKGTVPALNINEDTIYSIKATLEEDSQYGATYKIDLINTEYEVTTQEGKKAFLQSFLTDAQVKNLYSGVLGEDPFEVIVEGNVEALMDVKGIGEATANKIVEKYMMNKDFSEIYDRIPNLKISSAMVIKLVNRYGSPTVVADKLIENPYILADEVVGIGWRNADKIALSIGHNPNSRFRVSSFIRFFLSQRGVEGFSWVTIADLNNGILETVGEIPDDVFAEAMYYLNEEGIVVWNEAKTYIALKYYYELERQIAEELKRILSAKVVPMSDDKIRMTILHMEETQGWKFTEEQLRAVKLSLENNICLITGGSGVGKTSSVGATISVLDGKRFAQTALSGKASSRLQEVTGEEGFTIHRLLEYSPSKGFQRNSTRPLDHDVVILDECSMVGGEIFYALVRAIPTGTKLIILGDEGQLESIGSLNLFKDMIDSDVIPHIELKQIHRQALKSAIITEAKKVREMQPLVKKGWTGQEIRGDLRDLKLDIYDDKDFTSLKILENYKELYKKYRSVRDITVIVPSRVNGGGSALSINLMIQDLVNPETPSKQQITTHIKVNSEKRYFNIRVGDRVLVKKNNYKTVAPSGYVAPVFNGFLGTVIAVRDDEIAVDFDIVGEVLMPKSTWENILLGYAITGHSMQGSENKAIIVGLDYSGFMLLSKEWVYTAITRAREYCVVCAQSSALIYACLTSKVPNKQTFLKYFLQGDMCL